MSTKPMAYGCIENVLRHMDANKRFQISNRCPSLRNLEKRVPLKIKSLTLIENGVELDGVTYKIGIIRKYKEGRTPNMIARKNKMGGVPHEVDRFGIEDKSDAMTVTPGDVEMNERRRFPVRTRRAIIRSIEQSIERYERELATREDGRPTRSLMSTDQVEDLLEEKRAERFAWHCRQRNISPPYEHFVQLTMTRYDDGQEQKRIERYVHNKKYSEAVKKLTTVMFGGRKGPIHVTEMILDNCQQDVIRLPYGVIFHVQGLEILFGPPGTTLEALAPIIHESSYPLKSLSIDVHSEADVTNPVVQSAEKLEVGISGGNPRRILQIMSNRQVRLVLDPGMFPYQSMEIIVGDWIAANRPIGAEYTFVMVDEKPVFADDIEEILKRLNGVAIDEKNVIIPMNGAAQLKVSYGPFPEFSPGSDWAFKLLNEAIEH